MEHVAGRAVEAALNRGVQGTGYRVDAMTGPDLVVLTVTVGAGRAGLDQALAALRTVDMTAAARRYLTEEVPLYAWEGANKRNWPLGQPVLAALNEEDRLRLPGNCEKARTLPAVLPEIASAPVSVASELDHAAVSALLARHGFDARSVLRHGHTLAPALRPIDPDTPTRAFFVPLPQDGRAGRIGLASAAFWYRIDGTRAFGPQPTMIPLGSLGYQVTLQKPVSAREVSRLRAAPVEGSPVSTPGFRRARRQLCVVRLNAIEPVTDRGQRLATNSWAIPASFGGLCDGPATAELTRWESGPALDPVALPDPGAFDTSAPQPPTKPPPGVPILFCGFAPDMFDRYRNYYASVIHQLLIRELRFRRGMLLNVHGGQQDAPGCLGFEAIGARDGFAGALDRWIEALRADAAELERQLMAAHRAGCVRQPLAYRRNTGDIGCTASVKPSTIEQVRRALPSRE